MATTRAELTQEDIRRLLRGDSGEARAAAADRLCRRMDESALSEEERAAAQEIIRLIAQDAAQIVRRALAEALKASDLLPREVALKLARDVESVALPVLAFSPAFTDEDLEEIVRVCGPGRQIAVASRPVLSQAVTAALVQHGCEPAVRIACANESAAFSEASLQKAVSRFAHSQELLAAMARRRALPLAVADRLARMVGDELRDHLVNNHALNPETAVQIALGARERATVDLVEQAGRTADVERFVAHLNAEGRLTPSLLLRALANAHMTFFEWGVAELARVPHHRTWLMIHDAGPRGLRAIYERAGLPLRLFPAFRAGVDTYHAMEFEGGPRERQRFQERMLQRFLTQASVTPKEDLDYLLQRLDAAPRRRLNPMRAAARA